MLYFRGKSHISKRLNFCAGAEDPFTHAESFLVLLSFSPCVPLDKGNGGSGDEIADTQTIVFLPVPSFLPLLCFYG